MPRSNMDSTLLSQLAAGTVNLAFFFEGFFDSTVRFWTGIGNLVWGGNTWTGAGDLISLSQMQETGEVKAVGLTVSLSGVPPSTISLCLGSMHTGQIANCYIGAFDVASGQLISTPYAFFTGRVDVPTINDGAETATIALLLENRFIDFERERVRFYNTMTQQQYFPGDKGFDYIAALQDQDVMWGVASTV